MRFITILILISTLAIPVYAQEETSELDCIAAPPSFAEVGQAITVRDNAGRTLNLRSDPSSTSAVITELAPGTALTITDGPQCGDGNNLYVWWEVSTADGQTGWVAEGDSFQSPYLYFIQSESTLQDIEAITAASQASQCFAAPPSKLRVGEVVVVGENGGEILRLRSGPSTRGRVLRELKTDTILIIDEGPMCGEANDFYLWWRVRMEDGTTGWVAEGDSTQHPIIYFIRPIAEVRAEQGANPTICRAAPPSKLEIGKSAVIGENGGFVLRMREEPGTRGHIMENLTTGMIVKVLDGPQCGAENHLYAWWQIQLEDGRTGWVAEGDSFQNPDIYFLEPLGPQG